jgi:hypothetical protein
MEIAYKQLRYMPLTPRLKRLFISKKTAMHEMAQGRVNVRTVI